MRVRLLMPSMLLAACASQPMTPAPSPVASLAGSTWLLERIGDVAPPTPVSLSFTEDRVAGEAPCNRYTGAYAAGASPAMTIGPVAATRRACPHLDYEARFLSGLTDVASATVEGDRLVLRDAAGAVLMRFARA